LKKRSEKIYDVLNTVACRMTKNGLMDCQLWSFDPKTNREHVENIEDVFMVYGDIGVISGGDEIWIKPRPPVNCKVSIFEREETDTPPNTIDIEIRCRSAKM